MLRHLAGHHAHAGKARIFTFERRIERALPFGPKLFRQQAEPALAKARIRRHAQRYAARLVHMRQRAIGVQNFDAVHAHIQHVFLHANTAIQVLLGQHPIIHIHGA